MSMKDKTLHVYLGSKIKSDWQAYCESRGESPSVAAKRLIEAEIASGSGKFVTVSGHRSEDTPKRRFEILLTDSERAAIDRRAKIEGVSRRDWIVDAVRARLLNQTKPTSDVSASMWQTFSAGSAIKRDVDWMVATLKMGYKSSDSENFTVLEKAAAEITAAVEKLAELRADASWRRSIEEIAANGEAPEKDSMALIAGRTVTESPVEAPERPESGSGVVSGRVIEKSPVEAPERPESGSGVVSGRVIEKSPVEAPERPESGFFSVLKRLRSK